MKILLVCLGNICRSPTAEAAVREALEAVGLAGEVEVASAGTGSWHLGDPPDPRMRKAAVAVGLQLDGTACQVAPADFDRYDLLLAMDRSNAHELIAMAPDEAARAKVRLFREFDPDPDGGEVPDPYFGGAEGFERVVEICRRTAEGLAAYAERQLRP
jgi:protein-tyrosine phosphatase